MNVSLDKNKGVPRFQLEEKDMHDAQEILGMMQTKGWKIFKSYIEFGRETIIDSGKDGIRTRAKVELSPYKWAILKGWDELSSLADRIVERAKQFQEQEKAAKEEEKNARRTEDDEPI